MRRITLDIETAGSFSGPMQDPTELELTIVCTHNSETNQYDSFLKEELPRLWPILEHADLLVGYNSDHFDIPILNKYYAGDLARVPSLDLLKEIKNVLGRRLKLDNLAEATLGKKKSGNGLQAVKWWEEGEVEKVREYCIDDVRLTLELYEYAKKHGLLKYRDFSGGDVRDIKLDTSNWEKTRGPAQAMTHTLPF
ncbi:ribonuclease H-like domain-containing protein [Patescibacteria group bacterium]|nr:ribonuclease H-like domain-containing protein [Patescibacteria group bacterium]